tara:strand:- start:673 stop:828 length:156 start_codon:yes stop_codon:yes gene_type:complete
MSDFITYAIKLDKAAAAKLKEIAKKNERTLSGEIRHALRVHTLSVSKHEKR